MDDRSVEFPLVRRGGTLSVAGLPSLWRGGTSSGAGDALPWRMMASIAMLSRATRAMNCRHKLLRHAIEPVNHMHRCETARGAAARSVLSSSSISSDPNLKLEVRAGARGPLCLRVATVATSKASSGSSSIAVGRRRQHAAAPALARLRATPKHAHERERPARATLFFLAKGLLGTAGAARGCC